MTRAMYMEPMPSMLGFTNPESTGHARALTRAEQVQAHMLSAGADVQMVTHAATPYDLLQVADEQTLVYSDGGDGTVRGVIAAMAGIVPDNPERTVRNFADHAAIMPQLRYFAGAGGNANNWPLSAHGSFAVHPESLGQALLQLGFHRPLRYEVRDERGEIVRSHIATSGIGLGAAAIAAYTLEKAKPELAEKGRLRRLLGETALVLEATRHAPSFAIELSAVAKGTRDTQVHTNVTGLEFIKSKIYAKQGRTKVNVDDTIWQPVMLRRYPNKMHDNLKMLSGLGRLKLGRHALPAEDLTDLQLLIRVESDEPVMYHADGETDVDSVIYPGQTMRLRLAQIAIPTVMAS